MTYQNVSFCNSLLAGIPFVINGVNMQAKTSTDVILLQVAYQNKMREFDEFMQEVLKKIKKDGFDERMQNHTLFTDIEKRLKAHNEWKEGQTDADGKKIERPAKPSDSELEDAEKFRANEADFAKELEELDDAYKAAYAEKVNEKVADMKKFSRESYENIVEFIGFVGEISVSFPNREPVNMSKTEFLQLLGFNLVDLE